MSVDSPESVSSADPASCCSRRTALQSAGVLGAAVFGLTACGGGSGSDSGSGSGAGSSADGISTTSIPVGGGKVMGDAQVVVTQPTAGQFKAFSAVCTHAGCTVADVSGGTINCACHGSKFDIATGEVRQGPATRPLASKTATVSGDSVTVA